MKKLEVLLLMFVFVTVAKAQNLKEWEDPEIVEVNKEPGRTTFLSYPSASDALQKKTLR